MIVMEVEHGRVLCERHSRLGNFKVGQVKVERNVVESSRCSPADVQDDTGGQHRVDSALDPAIDGKR